MKRKNKFLYAILMIAAPLLGTAAGISGAVTAGIAAMTDTTGLSAKEIAELHEWDRPAVFGSPGLQMDFMGRGIPLTVVLCIAALGAAVGMCILTGSFSRDDNGRPVLNTFDHMWSELQLAICVLAAGGAIALASPVRDLMFCDSCFGYLDFRNVYRPIGADEYCMGLSNDAVLWYCTAGMALCVLLSAMLIASLVKKLKAGGLIRCSLLGLLLKLLGRGAGYTGAAARRAGVDPDRIAASIRELKVPAGSDRNAAVKLTVKYIAAALALIIVPELLVSWGNDDILLIPADIIAAAAAAVLIIRKIGRFNAVRTGVIEVRSGNLDYKIPVAEDSHGPKTDLDSLASDINSISEAAGAAVQREIKNQRLRTDLISNVSHDLKTPLTSMISYLDILEKEGLDSDEAPGHLAIVREKTERLRTLTEELFEAAKASSGNISCEIDCIDLDALIEQSLAELGDRLDGSGLVIRRKTGIDTAMVQADGKLLYRVLENLLVNISKYALPGSRVYIDISESVDSSCGAEARGWRGLGSASVNKSEVFGEDSASRRPDRPGTSDCLLLEIKNISKDELNVSPEELMERFTRGDRSRNTEGSGLGLAIAKDLVNLMGGRFDISIDGDMFKVSILLKKGYLPGASKRDDVIRTAHHEGRTAANGAEAEADSVPEVTPEEGSHDPDTQPAEAVPDAEGAAFPNEKTVPAASGDSAAEAVQVL